MSNQSVLFLRRVLLADAASCTGMGLGMLLFAAPLGALLNLPGTFIGEVGLVLLPCAAFVVYLASRRVAPRIGVWVLTALNAVWWWRASPCYSRTG